MGLGVLFDAVVALCAFAALLLSLWQEYARRQASRPRIRVKMATGFLGLLHGVSDGELLVEAANVGEKPVTLSTQALIRLPDGRRRLLLPQRNTHVSFPHELQTGKNCMTWLALTELAAELRNAGFHGKCRLVGIYKDQVDNIYESKPFEFDESGWPAKKSKGGSGK